MFWIPLGIAGYCVKKLCDSAFESRDSKCDRELTRRHNEYKRRHPGEYRRDSVVARPPVLYGPSEAPDPMDTDDYEND